MSEPTNVSAPVALVTGASRGIGKAIALALAADGCQLAVHYHKAMNEAADVVSAIQAAGGTAHPFPADLGDHAQAAELVKQVEGRLGTVTVLVCSAGILTTQLLPLARLEEWRTTMTTNLDSAFVLTKAVCRGMVRLRRGRIVYLSSDAALLGDLMRTAYSASKSGLLGLARSAARELAPSAITVNAVAPGLIETALLADMPETRRQKQLAAIPLGRFGKPEEVAGVVRFLCSADAAYITGQTLCVDGGLNTRG
jgi:3-oxoacyl-[acyl-carrier protein] reductase